MSAGPHPADPQTLGEWLVEATLTLAVGLAVMYILLWWLAPDLLQQMAEWCMR